MKIIEVILEKTVIHTEEECKHNLMIIASAPLLAEAGYIFLVIFTILYIFDKLVNEV